jgi:hypothetical protein
LQPLKGPRDTSHRRSAGSQSDRDRPSNASRGTRDQRDLAGQIHPTTCRTRDRSLGHVRDILFKFIQIGSIQLNDETGLVTPKPGRIRSNSRPLLSWTWL